MILSLNFQSTQWCHSNRQWWRFSLLLSLRPHECFTNFMYFNIVILLMFTFFHVRPVRTPFNCLLSPFDLTSLVCGSFSDPRTSCLLERSFMLPGRLLELAIFPKNPGSFDGKCIYRPLNTCSLLIDDYFSADNWIMYIFESKSCYTNIVN